MENQLEDKLRNHRYLQRKKSKQQQLVFHSPRKSSNCAVHLPQKWHWYHFLFIYWDFSGLNNEAGRQSHQEGRLLRNGSRRRCTILNEALQKRRNVASSTTSSRKSHQQPPTLQLSESQLLFLTSISLLECRTWSAAAWALRYSNNIKAIRLW